MSTVTDALRNYDPEKQGEIVYVPGSVEDLGALPIGTEIIKRSQEDGDFIPKGASGEILASHLMGGEIVYFVRWELFPDVPSLIVARRVEQPIPLPPEMVDLR